MDMKYNVVIALLGLSLFACKQKAENSSSITNTDSPTEQIVESTFNIYGNYVDDSYAKRGEGYDWVALTVKEHLNNSIAISVRSRADKKKPT